MKIAIFVVIAAAVIASLTAAIPLTNTAFADVCGKGTQDVHCSGHLSTQDEGNFKCDFSANKCAFSGKLGDVGGGRCTGPLAGATDCVGQLHKLH